MPESIYKFLQRILQVCLVLCGWIWGFIPGLARADIQVEVTGVEDEVRNNVLIFLSLQRYRERDDLPQDMVERLYQRTSREVRQALRPFGYYSPQVEGDLKRTSDKDWRVSLRIVPGPAVIVKDVNVRVSGPGQDHSALRNIIATTTLKAGGRLNHGAYDKLKGDLQRTAVSIGFLDAKLERSKLEVDLRQLTASARIELQTGNRYKFGPTELEQDAVNSDLARRFIRYQEGDFFDAGALLRTQFALDDSLYFTGVEIVPGARNSETLTVPVNIHAERAREDIYSIGLGYGTDTRARGTLGWSNRRVNRAGHRANIEITAADVEQSIETRYVIPVGDPVLEKLSFDTSARREELADLDVQTLEFKPGLTQVKGRWQRVLSIAVTHEINEAAGERTSDLLLIPGIRFARIPRDYTGDALSVPTGLYAELLGSHSAFGSDADFLRLNVRDEHVFDFATRWHLLLRGEIGLSMVAEVSELPGSQRFFAGGDRSVRGFGYNELSPTEPDLDDTGEPILDENGEPVLVKTGGRHLLVGSIEVVRDLPRNFGVALFTDFGNAFNKFGDPLEYSVGIGLRWRLPVVTVGIDVAQALSRSDVSPHFHLNISPQL